VGNAIATIERLESLRERGSITEDEFKTLKKRALNL
jgi:photosynthetic reaction center H subunit